MKEKGITLIALTITIIVLLIIASVSLGGAFKGVDEAHENKSESELKMVQHAILERYTKYKLTKDSTLLVGTVKNDAYLNELKLKDNEQWGRQINNSNDVDISQKYYELNKSNLENLGLESGTASMTYTYIVNYSTGEVYDTKNKEYLSTNKSGIVDNNSSTGEDNPSGGDTPSEGNITEPSTGDLLVYYDAKNNTGTGTYDPNATTWKNLSGDNYNGGLMNFNNTTSSGWQTEPALAFDGSNDWVKIGQLNPDAFTAEIVFETSNVNQDAPFFGNPELGGFDIYLFNKIMIYELYVNGDYASDTGTIIEPNKKYHFLLSYDGNTARFYQDGKLMAENQYNAAYGHPGYDTIIILGANPRQEVAYSDYFNGKIYSVRFYNKALTASEVTSNFNYEKERYGIEDKVARNQPIIHYDAKNNTGTGTYDKTATIWKNLSGNSYNGVLNGFNNTTSSGWQDGQYLKFDGSNDWVSIGNVDNNKFTLEAVLQYDEIPNSGESDIIANWEFGGYGLYGTSGAFESAVYNNNHYIGAQDSNSVDTSKKYHITTTFDGQYLILYKNGIEVKRTKIGRSYRPPNSNTILAIGANPSGQTVTGDYFNGKIYAIKVYDEAITPEQVTQNYNYEKERYNIDE